MRILVVDPLFSTLPYDRALCTALVEQGHDVVMLARPCKDGEEWPSTAGRHEIISVDDVFGKSFRSGWTLKLLTLFRHLRYSIQIQSVARHAARHRADVVHFQWCLTPMAEKRLVVRLKKHSAVCLTVHDTTPFNGSRVSSFVTRGLHDLMMCMDRLIVHTETAASALRTRGVMADRLSVVPHGMLQARKAPLVEESRCRERSAFVTCVMFGHIKHYKGVDILIHGVAGMSERARNGMRFVIAGQPGIDVEQLRRLCESKKISHLFEFHPRFFPDEEVDGIMQRADVFLFPYREIQASGVFMMALSYGRPVIASGIGLFAEKIKDGVNGLLVKAGDHEALGVALERIGADPELRGRMGRANLATSQTIPRWEKIADLTLETYKNAIIRLQRA